MNHDTRPTGPAPSPDLLDLEECERWFTTMYPSSRTRRLAMGLVEENRRLRALLPQGGPAPTCNIYAHERAFDMKGWPDGKIVEIEPDGTFRASSSPAFYEVTRRKDLGDPPKTEGRSAPGEPGHAAWWDDHLRQNSYRADVDENMIREATEDAWEVATSQAEEILHAWAKRRGYVVGPMGLQAPRREAPASPRAEQSPNSSYSKIPNNSPTPRGPMNPLTLLAALLLAGCINPLEGDYGPVEVVPEKDSCQMEVWDFDVATEEYSMRLETRPCEGKGHDIRIFGRRW